MKEDSKEEQKLLFFDKECYDQEEMLPYVSQEVEVRTSKDIKDEVENVNNSIRSLQLSDSYNGAIRDTYIWSQTITDVDVHVKLPKWLPSTLKAKDLLVNIETCRISIAARNGDKSTKTIDKNFYITFFDSELIFKIKKDESVWSLIPGYVKIHLEKVSEQWWNALITEEPKIDLNKIDCSRNLHEMGLMEQMKVEELMWNHKQKLLGKSTSDQLEKITKKGWNAERSSLQGCVKVASKLHQGLQPSDSYNGAIRDNYIWSQTITDIDVLVKLPKWLPSTLKAKDLLVNIETYRISISARNGDRSTKTVDNNLYITFFDNELIFKIKKDESVWNLVPGYVKIHLEKVSERWWNALITEEPKIDLNKIDYSRNLYEMGLMEQMKVEELMWNHKQKLLGKPTSDQLELEKIMKKAWNVKGSPFMGTEYDPSIIKYN